MRVIQHYRSLASVLLWIALSASALAQESEPFDPFAASALLEDVQTRVSEENNEAQYLTEARAFVLALQTEAELCESSATEERTRLEARYQHQQFEDITADVDPIVFDQFREVKRLLDEATSRHLQCASVRDTAKQLFSKITSQQTAISQQFLSHRAETILGAIRELPGRIASAPGRLRNSVSLDLIDNVTPILLFWLLIAGGILAALLGIYLRHRFTLRYNAAGGADSEPQFRFLFPKPLAEHAPLLLEGIVLTVVLLVTLNQATAELMVVRLAAAVAMYGFGLVVIDWATGPLSPSASVKGLIPDHVAPLRRRLSIFILTLIASFVVLGTNWLAIRALAPEVTGRATMIFVVAVALLYINSYLGRIPGLVGRFQLLRYLASLTLLVGIGALLLGYHNFAGYLIHGVSRTALALFLLWILLWSVFALFSYLVKGESESASQIRKSLGMTDKAKRSGLGFIQLVIDLVVWLGFLVFIIYVWDDSGTTLNRLVEFVVSGIPIGDELKLRPTKIAGGIFLFIGMIIVLGWVKRWIDRRWLQQIVMERGAREALITVFGYVGFVIAVIIGLTQAGVDLSGLAWVSGGLALGIGFGMQEIANNFVSGLILLFERPIRTGDFVSVGDIEGFVRSIRIRATEIETMDDQNVLVPNSELISGRVTNWVLRDTGGRLQIRVGVAYGSDIEKVREILETIAREHSEVITDGSAPAPRALFMGFGDSSLDFELRVRIFRIPRRFTVTSDLNFAIDAAFRKAHVSIPFPQRDLHVIGSPGQLPLVATKPVAPVTKKEDLTSTRVPSPSDYITRSHTEEINLPVDAKEVWAALTDIGIMKKWLVKKGEFAAHISGSFQLSLLDGTDMSGRIDIYIPKRRLRMVVALRQGEDPLPTGPITIGLQLKEITSGTTLTVTVAGIPADEDWEEDYKRSEVRWQTALEELKAVLEESS